MAIRIRITRAGVYDRDEKMIPVGTVLTLDSAPRGWINKYEVLNKAPTEEITVAATGHADDSPGAESNAAAPGLAESVGAPDVPLSVTETQPPAAPTVPWAAAGQGGTSEVLDQSEVLAALQARFTELTARTPDKRWGESRLREELSKLAPPSEQ